MVTVPVYRMDPTSLRRLECLTVILVLLWVYMQIYTPTVSAEEAALTDIFKTKSFQGSWEVINKFNWVGQALNFVISAFSVIGLCMIFYQRLISLLYLSSRNAFDMIYDIKNAQKGSSFFGFPALAKETWTAQRGGGVDAFIALGLGLLPNVKAYSDYNPEKRAYNLNEDDTVLTYMMKTAVPTLLLTFFFTIGFSGTLAQAFGTVVSGMATFADRAVAINVSGYVDKVLSTGQKYSFTIGDAQTADAKLAQKISHDIYGRVLALADIRDTAARSVVGKNVENWVWKEVLGSHYAATQPNGYNHLQSLVRKASGSDANAVTVANEADVSAIRYEIILNTSPTTAGNIGISKKMSEFITDGNSLRASGTPLAEQTYLHLILRKDRVSDANFFVVPKQ